MWRQCNWKIRKWSFGLCFIYFFRKIWTVLNHFISCLWLIISGDRDVKLHTFELIRSSVVVVNVIIFMTPAIQNFFDKKENYVISQLFRNLLIWSVYPYMDLIRSIHFYCSMQNYNRDLFWFLYLLLIIVSAITSFKVHNDKSPFSGKSILYLNRHQTEEWKGWMQVSPFQTKHKLVTFFLFRIVSQYFSSQ